MYRRVAVILGLLLLSCSSNHNPKQGSAECATHTSYISLGVDRTFSGDETSKLFQAAAEWGLWSSGRIRISLVSQGTGDGEVVRMSANDPLTLAEDKRFAEKNNTDAYQVLGWRDRSPLRVYVVTERIHPDVLPAVLAHELGHAVGVQYADPCQDNPMAYENASRHLRDCEHSADPAALMYVSVAGQTFGASDLDMCRASCLCP